MTMQPHLHKEGLAEVGDSGPLRPARKEEEEDEEASPDGDGGVGVVGWGEARR